MHNILDKNSTFKNIVRKDLKLLDQEILILKYKASDTRDLSELTSLVTYSESLKSRIRRQKEEISRPIKEYLNQLNDQYLRQCIEIEEIMKPVTYHLFDKLEG